MTDKIPSTNVIAGLHDLLKLTGDNKCHWCPENLPQKEDLKKAHPDLWKALKHHCVFRASQHGCRADIDREAFCISFADHKASAISRRLRRVYASREVYHVWRDEPTPYGDPNPVSGVVDYACQETNLEKVLEKYAPDLQERPETLSKGDGSSFTSLLTHGELTAAWARFFMENADYYGIPESASHVWQILRGRQGSGLLGKSVLLLRCRVRTHGRLARLRDLQMVREIEDRKTDAVKALGGVLIYDLPEEALIAVRPDLRPAMESSLQDILTTNHYIELADAETPLMSAKRDKHDFLHNFGLLFGGFPKVAYPELQEEIRQNADNEASSHAIICDLCQLAPATVQFPQDVYPDETDPVNEYLCAECAELRKRSTTRAKKLAAWERSLDEGHEEDRTGQAKARPRVCLVKVSLDMNLLPTALAGKFEETFKDKLKDRKLGDQDLGFSILHEFVLDYNRFVKKFEESILAMDSGGYSGDNHDLILDGFMVLRIEKDCEVAEITRQYVELYDEYFPRLKGPTFPIKLSISCSYVKHPFLEHWEVLDNPTSAINVQSVRRAQLNASFDEFGALDSIGVDENRRVNSFLHNLAEIEARTGSRLLVKFTLLEKHRDAERVAAPFMSNQVSIDQILSYYKLFARDGRG